MDEFSFTLNSPITEEQWDMITDVDFDHTNEIMFRTKHGKEVEFVKKSAQPTGKWKYNPDMDAYVCDQCGEPCAGYVMQKPRDRFCKWCGAKLEGTE